MLSALASGGANYLAIKDMGDSSSGAEGGTALLTATAGAPANSLHRQHRPRRVYRSGCSIWTEAA